MTLVVDRNNKNYETILNEFNHVEIRQNGTTLYWFPPSKLEDGLEIKLTDKTPIDVFFISRGARFFLTAIVPSDSAIKAVDIIMPANYVFDGNKVVCPKCSRSDQTKPYTVQGYWFEESRENGEFAIFITEDSISKPGIILHPIYSGAYKCDRDSIQF